MDVFPERPAWHSNAACRGAGPKIFFPRTDDRRPGSERPYRFGLYKSFTSGHLGTKGPSTSALCCLFMVSHDHDRAARVPNAVLAHGTQQHADKGSVPAAAND